MQIHNPVSNITKIFEFSVTILFQYSSLVYYLQYMVFIDCNRNTVQQIKKIKIKIRIKYVLDPIPSLMSPGRLQLGFFPL